MIALSQSQMLAWGSTLVFVNVLLTRLGVPVPAAPVLLFAGSAIARGALSLDYVLPAAIAGALLGDSVWFAAGRIVGPRLIAALGRRSASLGTHVRNARTLFERHGAPLVSVSKFIPGLAIATPPLMGCSGVDPRIFVAWDTAGAAIWAGFWLLGGALFEPQLALAAAIVRAHGATMIDLVLGGSLLFVVVRGVQRWHFRRWLARVQLTPEQLDAAMRSALPPVILDARPPAAGRADAPCHAGAVQVDANAPASFAAALPAQGRVVYCVCPDEACARHLAHLLRRQGFRRIRALKGGLDAWTSRGYPLDAPPARGAAAPGGDTVTLRAMAPGQRVRGPP